ncbi:MAG: hypothetical protein AAB916_02475 [Patescibacteria group bacterium]
MDTYEEALTEQELCEGSTVLLHIPGAACIHARVEKVIPENYPALRTFWAKGEDVELPSPFSSQEYVDWYQGKCFKGFVRKDGKIRIRPLCAEERRNATTHRG